MANLCNLVLAKTQRVWFLEEIEGTVDWVFLIDVTDSTDGGARMREGVEQTVGYLYAELRAQGRTFRVAGIKFSNVYLPNAAVGYNQAELREFAILGDTAARDAFNAWVDAYVGPDGDREYQLDILMFAKDMAPGAVPGMYVALATDENSDSTLNKSALASALAQCGSIVFIDPGRLYDPDNGENLVTYYTPLAVNGGCVEAATLGQFTFPHLREAVVGVP